MPSFPLPVLTLLLGTSVSVGAEPFAFTPVERPEAVFGFAGVMTKEDMGSSAIPFTVKYERRGIVGAGYQHFVHETRHGIQLGGEIGVSMRFVAGTTGELWAGPVVRHEGVTLFDRVRVSPSFTAALNVVTDAHNGRERDQERLDDGDATLLFYLGPEIAFSSLERPDRELFWRLHHRSGANGTLGNMRGALNANVIGFRWRY